jgi:hypothetical protein
MDYLYEIIVLRCIYRMNLSTISPQITLLASIASENS